MKPAFQFRGIWLPARIIRKLAKRKITKTELLLLVMIESFVESGKGCWATNRYFADMLGINKNYVSDCINNLIGSELVQMKVRKGIRWLETCWSGEMQDHTENSVSPPTENSVRPLRKIPYQNNRKELKRKVVPSAKRNGELPDSFDEECSALLYRKLLKEKRITKGTAARLRWPEYFKKLRKKLDNDKNRIRRVLDGYLENFGVQYIPVAYSARKFCDTSEENRHVFFRIEDAINRIEGKVKRQEEDVIS